MGRRGYDGDPQQRLRQVIEGLDFIGFGKGCRVATSAELQREDEWSAVVPPIPLWPVSRRARVAPMTRRVYFAAVVKPDLWEKAMLEEGLTLEEDGAGGWRVAGTSGEVRLDIVEVQKLSLGVAFTGISPRDVAQRVAEFLALKTMDSS